MMRRAALSVLPPHLSPRGLAREQAAEYVGVGVTKFDEMVVSGAMPQPKRIDGRKVWDIRALDRAFDRLPSAAPPVPGGVDDRAGDPIERLQ